MRKFEPMDPGTKILVRGVMKEQVLMKARNDRKLWRTMNDKSESGKEREKKIENESNWCSR